MPFAATWMELEILRLSHRKTNTTLYDLYLDSKKKDTNELIYKTETDSQTQKTILWSSKGKVGVVKLGVLD